MDFFFESHMLMLGRSNPIIINSFSIRTCAFPVAIPSKPLQHRPRESITTFEWELVRVPAN